MKPTKFSWLLPLLALGWVFAPFSAAKDKQYVEVEKAVINSTALQPGQKASVAVVLKIKEGFHIQSHAPKDENLIKSELSVDKNGDIKFLDPVYPPAVEEKYSFSDEPLSVYTGTITVFVPIEVSADAKPGETTIAGKFSFQACDKNGCFPPTNVTFKIATKIVAAGEKVDSANGDVFKKS